MSTFVRILKVIGRALRRAIFAIGRFFKFLFKRMGKSSKISKLNKSIAKNEKAIEKLYSEIGRNYYEAHCDAPEALLSELVGGVSENKSLIAASEEKIEALQEAYKTARAEAKEKAKARRASDKEKAQADKAKAKGELPAEAPVEEPVIAAPVVETPVVEEPAPVVEEPVPVVEVPAVEAPAPVLEEPAPVEEAPVVEEPAPVEEAPVVEEPVTEPAPQEIVDAAPAAPAEETVPAE